MTEKKYAKLLNDLRAVMTWGSATPRLATDIDNFASPSEWGLVRNTVKTLDDLGSRSAQTERESAIAQRVYAGRRHGQEPGRARVNRHDGRTDLERRGSCGQVPHERRAIEAPDFGDPNHVEASLLKRHDITNRGVGVAAVGHQG